MRALLISIAVVALAAGGPGAQTRAAKTLDIYVIDAEGGKATLFVSPSGESALIDSGNPGTRDVDRIMAVLSEAGIKRIDYLISTHYHVDHIGGMTELAGRVPIAHYVDHGPSVEAREQVSGFQQAYADLRSKAKHIVVKPGDKLPIAGLEWRIVTAGGKTITSALPGGGKPNPFCAQFKPRDNQNDADENWHSVGSVISFGRFRTIDLGDLLWNNEFDLMCPNNPIGAVDVYLTSHHGIDSSGSSTLVHALQPRVAITQNGTRKGATLQTSGIINSSPGFDDLWQLHWSHNGGVEHNPAGLFVANVDDAATIAAVLTTTPPAGRGGPTGAAATTPPAATTPVTPPSVAPPPTGNTPPAAASPAQPGTAPTGTRQGGPGGAAHTGPAHWIKVSAHPDGSFIVTNSRNGFSKMYVRR
jgi:competence protein ComEC